MYINLYIYLLLFTVHLIVVRIRVHERNIHKKYTHTKVNRRIVHRNITNYFHALAQVRSGEEVNEGPLLITLDY